MFLRSKLITNQAISLTPVEYLIEFELSKFFLINKPVQKLLLFFDLSILETAVSICRNSTFAELFLQII